MALILALDWLFVNTKLASSLVKNTYGIMHSNGFSSCIGLAFHEHFTGFLSTHRVFRNTLASTCTYMGSHNKEIAFITMTIKE